MRNIMALLVGLTAALGGAGCDDHDVGVVRESWTIDQRTDPASCTNVRAVEIRFVVVDSAGNEIARQTAPCSAFAATLPLNPGVYSVTATFLGERGIPISFTQSMDRLPIADDEETTLGLNFSSSDFTIPN